MNRSVWGRKARTTTRPGEGREPGAGNTRCLAVMLCRSLTVVRAFLDKASQRTRHQLESIGGPRHPTHSVLLLVKGGKGRRRARFSHIPTLGPVVVPVPARPMLGSWYLSCTCHELRPRGRRLRRRLGVRRRRRGPRRLGQHLVHPVYGSSARIRSPGQ